VWIEEDGQQRKDNSNSNSNNNKGKGKGKSNGCAIADGSHPTHRRVRDGWGTRAFRLRGGKQATAVAGGVRFGVIF
jgi:hypothetical protein